MKLITWNIQWGRGADGRVDLDRIVAHARRFADADVLCIQEAAQGFAALPGVRGDESYNVFDGLAQRLSGYTAVCGVGVDLPGNGGRRRRFGNMILSRYPVQQVFAHLLPWPAETGVNSMQRVALESTLDTPLGAIRVTTTHLEYYSQRQRLEQVAYLRNLQREAVAHARMSPAGVDGNAPFARPPRGGPAILTGDFNFRPDAPEHGKMTAAIDDATPRYLDAWEVAHPDEPRPPTLGVYDKRQWPGPAFACDFIFVSEDLRHAVRDVRVDETTDASDHQPMLIELD